VSGGGKTEIFLEGERRLTFLRRERRRGGKVEAGASDFVDHFLPIGGKKGPCNGKKWPEKGRGKRRGERKVIRIELLLDEIIGRKGAFFERRVPSSSSRR